MEALCEGTRDAGAIKQVRDAGNAAADASRKLCESLPAELHDLRITQTGLITFNSMDMYTDMPDKVCPLSSMKFLAQLHSRMHQDVGKRTREDREQLGRAVMKMFETAT